MGQRVRLVLLVGLLVGCRERAASPAAFQEPSGPRVLVEVLNASGVPGLAREGTRHLRQQGLDVVFFGNADQTVDSTRVLVRRGDGSAGARVARALGLGAVSRVEDTLRRVDVTVLLGRDYRPPPRFPD
jgi:hypothetical protein